MKRLSIIVLMCLAAVGCTDTPPAGVGSLKASPQQITFEAENAEPQKITVTAENVEWEYALTEEADKWITVERKDNILTLTANDNASAEPRTAVLTVRAKESEEIKAANVSINQQGADISYSIAVSPATITFEAEGSGGQEVAVTTVGEGLTWKTEVEDTAKSWITVSEGEGKFTVTVADNPEAKERSANIAVIPDKESADPKAVRVTQKAKYFTPSLNVTLDNGAAPEEGFAFDYLGTKSNWRKVLLTPVNLKWDAYIKYSSDVTDWVEIHPYQSEDVNHVEILVNKNESPDPRTCSLIITTDAEGVGPFQVDIAQEGMPDFLSSLTEDVEMKNLAHASAIVKPNSDTYTRPYTVWDIRFWSDGIEFNGLKYTGSGDKICVYVASEPINENPENIYNLPEGVYNVVANFNYSEDATPGTVSGGAEFYSPDFPLGTWYQRIENDAYTGDACITEGVMTVSGSGDSCAITLEFVSDAGYAVTGSYQGKLEVKAQ